MTPTRGILHQDSGGMGGIRMCGGSVGDTQREAMVVFNECFFSLSRRTDLCILQRSATIWRPVFSHRRTEIRAPGFGRGRSCSYFDAVVPCESYPLPFNASRCERPGSSTGWWRPRCEGAEAPSRVRDGELCALSRWPAVGRISCSLICNFGDEIFLRCFISASEERNGYSIAFGKSTSQRI